MKNSGFKRRSYDEMLIKKATSKAKTAAKKKVKSKDDTVLAKPKLRPIKLLKKDLYTISHDFVRERDSIPNEKKKGYCCTCGKFCSGGDFQAGHFIPSATCGALLRYHPHNMHGQGGFCCNIARHGQQDMGNRYTLFMIKKYGLSYVHTLRHMKEVLIKADRYFYETMIALYKEGDESEIIKFLDGYL